MKQTKRAPPGSLRRSRSWVWLVLLSIVGCTSMPPAKDYETPGALRTELDGDVRTLNAVRPHLEALDDDFVALRKQGDWVKRGYFSVAENERMEHLLFRFVTSHSALWDISAAYQNMQTSFIDPALDTKAHVVSRQASLLLANHSAFLVAEFAGDPVAIAKMNEAFYRSEIPSDSYYQLARGISAQRLSRLKRAGALAAKELAKPNSKLARLAASDASYRELVELNKTLQIAAETRMLAALDTKGASDPEAIRKTDVFFRAVERSDFLIEVFSYLGEAYDFRFDFADSTSQVCTEVIYRGIQGKGGIAFELTVRAGHETLSADDIALYYLNKHPGAFQFVLYAEEDPNGKDHEALILTGTDGIQRLKELVKTIGE